MSTPPNSPPAKPPLSIIAKANRVRGAAAVPYRTAKMKRVLKLSKR